MPPNIESQVVMVSVFWVHARLCTILWVAGCVRSAVLSKPVWALDPDDKSDVCGHFRWTCVRALCPLWCSYRLCTSVHSAEMVMFWLCGLSSQLGCNIVWFYQWCSLMWSRLNGGQQSWRLGLWGKPGPGITSLPRNLLTGSRVLSFAGDTPGGGEPNLLPR